jgi:hypothetical protein
VATWIDAMELRMETEDEQAALSACIAELERQVAEPTEWLTVMGSDVAALVARA